MLQIIALFPQAFTEVRLNRTSALRAFAFDTLHQHAQKYRSSIEIVLIMTPGTQIYF